MLSIRTCGFDRTLGAKGDEELEDSQADMP